MPDESPDTAPAGGRGRWPMSPKLLVVLILAALLIVLRFTSC